MGIEQIDSWACVVCLFGKRAETHCLLHLLSSDVCIAFVALQMKSSEFDYLCTH